MNGRIKRAGEAKRGGFQKSYLRHLRGVRTWIAPDRIVSAHHQCVHHFVYGKLRMQPAEPDFQLLVSAFLNVEHC